MPRIVPTAKLQEQHKILNAFAEFNPIVESDSALQSARDTLGAIRHKEPVARTAKSALVMLRNIPKIATAAYYIAKGETPYQVLGKPHIAVEIEQQPNPDSRVCLSDELDSLGQRRVKLNWKISDLDIKTIATYAKLLADELNRLNAGSLDLSSLEQNADDWIREYAVDTYHHMGTLRMNENPKLGVVNSNCQTHQYDNLYVASSAVFPTGGFSNPTLTILALTLRIADTLKRRLAS
jgi:choline dehydrogenase-like flavoprotein